MKGQTLTIIVLSILLVAAIVYVCVDYSKSVKAEKLAEQNSILQQGAQLGYQQAFVDVAVAISQTCDPVPLVIGNVTINVIRYDCLQPASS